MTKWRKGPPPSIGWWPASATRCALHFRWWDGSCWSVLSYSFDSATTAAFWAARRSSLQSDIEWTDRPADWPERSRT